MLEIGTAGLSLYPFFGKTKKSWEREERNCRSVAEQEASSATIKARNNAVDESSHYKTRIIKRSTQTDTNRNAKTLGDQKQRSYAE